MKKLFTKILVPINFNRNTSLVVDKAIQLANHFDCDIHLVHVQMPTVVFPFFKDGFFPGLFIKQTYQEKVCQLKELEQKCKHKLNYGISITSTITTGNWQPVLKRIIIAEHIDLLIVPRSQLKFGTALIQQLNLDKLSQQTQCPVLTVTRSFDVNHLQNIVVPINDSLPVRKLTVASYICREANGNIHLMPGEGKTSDGKNRRRYMIKAYQLLNDYCKVRIHCWLPDKNDNPTKTLAYARDVKADLVVMNSGLESLPKGWWNKLRGKYLYKESEIPVLTIAS